MGPARRHLLAARDSRARPPLLQSLRPPRAAVGGAGCVARRRRRRRQRRRCRRRRRRRRRGGGGGAPVAIGAARHLVLVEKLRPLRICRRQQRHESAAAPAWPNQGPSQGPQFGRRVAEGPSPSPQAVAVRGARGGRHCHRRTLVTVNTRRSPPLGVASPQLAHLRRERKSMRRMRRKATASRWDRRRWVLTSAEGSRMPSDAA